MESRRLCIPPLIQHRVWELTRHQTPTNKYMMPIYDSTMLALASAIALTIGVTLLYYRLLPKPFTGIPYNKDAVGRLFGDAPDMKAAPRVRAWLRGQFAEHDSPIVQVFVVPFSKPWILVSDFREAQDVMLRRTADFDRSSLTTDSFGGVMQENHVCMKSSDPRFPHNRELVRDLMTPSFLARSRHQKYTRRWHYLSISGVSRPRGAVDARSRRTRTSTWQPWTLPWPRHSTFPGRAP